MESKIRNLIKERGLTQKQLAQKIGMSEVGLSKALNVGVSKSLLPKISSALEVDEAELSGVDLYSMYEGELHIGDKSINCAVLNNGTRVLTATAVFSAFDRPRKGKSSESYRADQMPSFLNANNLQPFVDEQLEGWTKLMSYKGKNGQILSGYDARILRGICKVYIDANRAGALAKSQERFVAISETILYSLSDVGIIALVDEATGYDKVKTRAKDALQKFFEAALLENAGRWVKTFPDKFFETIYRMRGWNWNGMSTHPSVVGIWINDIVYSRIAPVLLEELRRLNPSVEGKGRKYKHHQFLTEEVGHPKLKEHIEGVLAIARLSDYNWNRFMRFLDKAYPKQYQQLDLFNDDIEIDVF